MPLHYKTKETAVKKYGHLAGDQLQAVLGADSNNYAPEEIKEIVDAINKALASGPAPAKSSDPTPATPAVPATPAKKAPLAVTSPNAEIAEKLKAFDYESLRGEAFKKYCLFVQGLQMDRMYDFELFHVEVVKRERYRGVKDTPIDTVGFKIKNNRPINTTRIPVKHALQNNGRVEPYRDADGTAEETGFETIGCQLDHNGSNGRYYLLKKVS